MLLPRRLISEVDINIYAEFSDPEESCEVLVRDTISGVWVGTGQRLSQGLKWHNLTFTDLGRYLDGSDRIYVMFRSEIDRQPWVLDGMDANPGVLSIEYMETVALPYALKVDGSGGRDAMLERLWIDVPGIADEWFGSVK